MNIYTKLLCYAALMGVWGVFAYLKLTPVEGFISAVTAAIAALGAIHAGDVSSRTAPPAPPPAAPPKDAP